MLGIEYLLGPFLGLAFYQIIFGQKGLKIIC